MKAFFTSCTLVMVSLFGILSNGYGQTFDSDDVITAMSDEEVKVPKYSDADQNVTVNSLKLAFRLSEKQSEYIFDDLDASVSLSVKVQDTTGTPVDTFTVALSVSAYSPLQVVELDFSEHREYGAFYISTIESSGLDDSSRLQIELLEDVGYGLLESNGTSEIIPDSLGVTELVDGTGLTQFEWKLPLNQRFDAFDLEVLKVEPYLDGNVDLDWKQANRIEVDTDYITSTENTSRRTYQFTMMMTEGKGYYFWRIRPISSYYPGLRADKRNYGTWSGDGSGASSLFTGTSSHHSFPSSNETNPLPVSPTVLRAEYFHMEQPDNDINWIYNRVFTEGSRVSETMTYANGLNQVQQVQTKLFSKSNVVATQTVYDYSGRPALSSLPAPLGKHYLKYEDGILKSGGQNYSASHFDAGELDEVGRTYDDPETTDDGQIHNYYSDNNSDLYVPSAKGYPFTRTLFESNATGRVYKQSGVGGEMNLAKDRNVTTLYSGVAQDELDRIFASEAPLAESVYKVITIDPNKVVSISYVAKSGQVIATCLSTVTDNQINMEPLDSAGFVVKNTFPSASPQPGEVVASSSKTIALADPVLGVPLNFNFNMEKDFYGIDCEDICSECDYRVEIEMIYLDDPTDQTRNFRVSFDIPPGAISCTTAYTSPSPVGIADLTVEVPDGNGGYEDRATASSHPFGSDPIASTSSDELPLSFSTDNLLQGVYQVTKRVYVNNADGTGVTYFDQKIEELLTAADEWEIESLDLGNGEQNYFITCCDTTAVADFSFSCDIDYPVCNISGGPTAADIAEAIGALQGVCRELDIDNLPDQGYTYSSVLNSTPLSASYDMYTESCPGGKLDVDLLDDDISTIMTNGKSCQEIMTCFTLNSTLLDINIDLANTYAGQAMSGDSQSNPTEIGFDADFDFIANSFSCLDHNAGQAPGPCKELGKIYIYWGNPMIALGTDEIKIEIPKDGIVDLTFKNNNSDWKVLAHNLSCVNSYYDIDYTTGSGTDFYFTLNDIRAATAVTGITGDIRPEVEESDFDPLELICSCKNAIDTTINTQSLKELSLEQCYKACDDKRLAAEMAIDNSVIDHNAAVGRFIVERSDSSGSNIPAGYDFETDIYDFLNPNFTGSDDQLELCMIDAVIENCKQQCYAEVLFDLEERSELGAGYEHPEFPVSNIDEDYTRQTIWETQDYEEALAYTPKVTPSRYKKVFDAIEYIPDFIYNSLYDGMNTVKYQTSPPSSLVTADNRVLFGYCDPNDDYKAISYSYEYEATYEGASSVEGIKIFCNVIYDSAAAEIIEVNFIYHLGDPECNNPDYSEYAYWYFNPSAGSCFLNEDYYSMTKIHGLFNIFLDESSGLHIIVNDTSCSELANNPVAGVSSCGSGLIEKGASNISTTMDNFAVSLSDYSTWGGYTSTDYLWVEVDGVYLTEDPIYFNTDQATTLSDADSMINAAYNQGIHQYQSYVDTYSGQLTIKLPFEDDIAAKMEGINASNGTIKLWPDTVFNESMLYYTASGRAQLASFETYLSSYAPALVCPDCYINLIAPNNCDGFPFIGQKYCPPGYDTVSTVINHLYIDQSASDPFKPLDYHITKLMNQVTAFWEATIEEGIISRKQTPDSLIQFESSYSLSNYHYFERVWNFNLLTSKAPNLVAMKAYANVVWDSTNMAIKNIQVGLAYKDCNAGDYENVIYHSIKPVNDGNIMTVDQLFSTYQLPEDVPYTFAIEDVLNIDYTPRLIGSGTHGHVMFDVSEEYLVALDGSLRMDYDLGAGVSDVITPPNVGHYMNDTLISDYTSAGCSLTVNQFDTCSICLKWERADFEQQRTPLPTVEVYECDEENISYQSSSYLSLKEKCITDRIRELEDQYEQSCLQNITDTLLVTYTLAYHHYTLYRYDRAGNLLSTVPPAGVEELELYGAGGSTSEKLSIDNYRNGSGSGVFLFDTNQTTHHKMITDYNYNSIGQLFRQHTPDGGESNFWYNAAGQLVLSQDAAQEARSADPVHIYSYTKYDNLGRISEVGEVADSVSLTQGQLVKQASLDTIYNSPNRSYITYTTYTLPAGSVTCNGQSQQNLRNRVSHAYTDIDGDDDTPSDQVHTYYSYDPHGNVEWLMQDIPEIGRRSIRYEFDLVSGNVNYVYYNENDSREKFIHKYMYDEDNRITEVYTSRDGVIWDKDAGYGYYIHGALERSEIGQDKIQGIDYVYTIEGYLKSINQPELDPKQDPGRDLLSTNFLMDEFAMELGYYDGDFNRLGVQIGKNADYTPYNGVSPLLEANETQLFNGNINYWALNTRLGADKDVIGAGAGSQQGLKINAFRYDKLNRLRSSDLIYEEIASYTNALSFDNTDGDPYTSDIQALSTTAIHGVRLTYDGNGNIQTLKRTGHTNNGAITNTLMDDFSYNYSSTGENNKLLGISEAMTTSSKYTTDIDPMTYPGSNYVYDAEGNLIADKAENIVIEWTPYGKVSEVREYASGGTYDSINHNFSTSLVNTIEFVYDAAGNRVMKRTTDGDGGQDGTYYVRDASGNVMAVYGKTYVGEGNTDYRLKELPLYGSSRLGNFNADTLLSSVSGSTDHMQQQSTRSEQVLWHIGGAGAEESRTVDFTNPDEITSYTAIPAEASNCALYLDEDDQPLLYAYVNSSGKLSVANGSGTAISLGTLADASTDINAFPVIVRHPDTEDTLYVFYQTGTANGYIGYTTINITSSTVIEEPTNITTHSFANSIAPITYADGTSRLYVHGPGEDSSTVNVYSIDLVGDEIETPELRATFKSENPYLMSANGELTISPKGDRLALGVGFTNGSTEELEGCLAIWEMAEACGTLSNPAYYRELIGVAKRVEFSHSGKYLYYVAYVSGASGLAGNGSGGNTRVSGSADYVLGRLEVTTGTAESLFEFSTALENDIQRAVGDRMMLYSTDLTTTQLHELTGIESNDPNDVAQRTDVCNLVNAPSSDYFMKQTYFSEMYMAQDTAIVHDELANWMVGAASSSSDISSQGTNIEIWSANRNLAIAEDANENVVAKFIVNNSDVSILLNSDGNSFTNNTGYTIFADKETRSLFVKAAGFGDRYFLITGDQGDLYYSTIDVDYDAVSTSGIVDRGRITAINQPLTVQDGGTVQLTYEDVIYNQYALNAYNNVSEDGRNYLFAAVHQRDTIKLFQFPVTHDAIGEGVMVDYYIDSTKTDSNACLFLHDMQVSPNGNYLGVGVSKGDNFNVFHYVFEYDIDTDQGAEVLSNRRDYSLSQDIRPAAVNHIADILDNLTNQVTCFDYADDCDIYYIRNTSAMGASRSRVFHGGINHSNNTVTKTVSPYIYSYADTSKFTPTIRRGKNGYIYIVANDNVNKTDVMHRFSQTSTSLSSQTVFAPTNINGSIVLQPYLQYNSACENVLESLMSSTYTREVDKRVYELSDHLGNVRTVVGDRRMATVAGDPGYSENLYAGTGTSGSTDSTLLDASFDSPIKLDVDSRNNVYVVSARGSSNNYDIRILHANGDTTSTYDASTIPNKITYLSAVAVDRSNDNIFFASGRYIYVIREDTISSTYIDNTQFVADMEIVNGTLYTAVDTEGDQVRTYDVSNLPADISTVSLKDAIGTGNTSDFSKMMGIAINRAETKIYVADQNTYQVKVIDVASGGVSVLAGSGTYGYADGSSTTAQFRLIRDVSLSADERYVYVAGYTNECVRAIEIATGDVTTVIKNGVSSVSMGSVEGLALGINGNLFTSERSAHKIRKIDIDYTEAAGAVADVKSLNDYYPFGMIKPGRNYNSPDYRYGFNGMEKDDEVKGTGNSYDFGARMHDPRLGRLWSPDPKERDYPWQSTYVFAANNPIRYVDFYGEGPGDRLTGEQVKNFFNSDLEVSSYEITIYAKQPVPNSGDILDGRNFGHAFVSFKVTYADGSTKVLYVGLYPEGDNTINPVLGTTSGKGRLQDDSNASANAMLNKEVKKAGFDKALKLVESLADDVTYDINTYNCTDFAINCFNNAGGEQVDWTRVDLKGNYWAIGDYDYGKASMPGPLGEDIEEAGGEVEDKTYVPGDDQAVSGGDDDKFDF